MSLLVLLAAAAAVSGRASQHAGDLQSAIQLYADGHLQEAALALDAIVSRLRPAPPADRPQLIDALVYKGAALVGLAQEAAAKASFAEALTHDPGLRLTEDRFPPRVVRVFEAARLGETKSVLEPPSRVPKKAALGAAAVAGAALGGAALGSGSKTIATPPPAAPTAAASPAAANRPPTARINAVQPSGIGIFNVTNQTLIGTGTDPDGDALAFSWDFGDGTSGTGENVAHTFPRAATFEVRLTVTDGRGGSASDTRSVTVGSLRGQWTVQYGSLRDTATITQNENGRNIVGRLDRQGLAFSGIVRHPREIEIVVLHGSCGATYRGSAFENLRLIPVTGGGCSTAQTSISFSR